MILLTESSFRTEVLSESDSSGKKSWYIGGVFLQSDVVNRNRRIYPKSIMEAEINNYINEYVIPKRSVGELSHPNSPVINLDKITHITESIEQSGKDFYGKAKILNTPCGNIVSGLLEGGVQLGVSSRALGSVRTNSNGINEVQSDFKLAAIDIVYAPSAPDAFVNALMEGAPHIWDTITEDTDFLDNLKSDIHKTNSTRLQEEKIRAFAKFLEKIKN